MNVKWCVFILVAMMAWGTIAAAEDIANDSGCDVCAGAIHFGPEETRKIFGDEIREKINSFGWQGQKCVWVDLDGALKNTETPKDESLFEIKIYGTVLTVFIKSLIDGSVMELIVNNVEEVKDDAPAEMIIAWYPEIYLYAGDSQPINLTDSLDVAWSKLKERHVFQWAGRGKDVRVNPEELRKQIMTALKTLAP